MVAGRSKLQASPYSRLAVLRDPREERARKEIARNTVVAGQDRSAHRGQLNIWVEVMTN